MRKKSWGEYPKSLLDLIIEKCRYSKIKKYIKRDSVVLDLGCGYDAKLLQSFQNIIKKGIGIDLNFNQKNEFGKIKLIRGKADEEINLQSDSVDTVICLALIEHVGNPNMMLSESFRILKGGGNLLLTTPSRYAKPLLEFLAFNLGVISKEEISDHKRYYDKKSLETTLLKAGFKKNKMKIRYFQLGLNIFVRAVK